MVLLFTFLVVRYFICLCVIGYSGCMMHIIQQFVYLISYFRCFICIFSLFLSFISTWLGFHYYVIMHCCLLITDICTIFYYWS